MNPTPLERLLRAGDVPPPPPGSAAGFARDVRVQLGPRPARAAVSGPVRSWRSLGLLGASAAAIVLGFGLWRGALRPPATRFPAEQVAAAMELARQMEELFPGQWSAVVFELGGPRLVLAEGRAVRGSRPLLVTVCPAAHGPADCPVVLTFSGTTLEVAGRQVDILLDPAGQAIVAEPGGVGTSPAHLL
jgi:hypothetical protein